MGKPVIASRIGGLSDIVRHNKTGILFAPGNIDELSAAMDALQRNASSRNAMGAMARQEIINFQAGSVVSRIEQIYREVS